jgi:hypothetical protein
VAAGVRDGWNVRTYKSDALYRMIAELSPAG